MSPTTLQALLRVAGFIASGAVIGWLLGGFTIAGVVAAALLLVAYNLYRVVVLERELRGRGAVTVPDGTGLWSQTLARIQYLNTRIARAKKRYRQVLREIRNSANALPDGVVAIDDQNEIVRYNRSARRLLGLRKRRDRGQRVDNLVRHPDFVSYLREPDDDDGVSIPSPVDDSRWLRCAIVPYAPGMRLVLFRDITEQTRLAKMRRDFVANASHELRSPLTVISGYLDGLGQDGAAPAEWQRPIAEMQRQADRMANIVNDLLDLSRLESDAPASVEHTVDVGALIESVIAEQVAADHAPAVETAIRSDRQLLGNSSQLLSIVANLVQNAIRHTPADGRITLSWEDTEDGGAILAVEDTGEGISPDDIPRVTERFFRADRGRARNNGGTGLGLAIVKHALARHDATLAIESEPGSGSRFLCRFPASRLSAPARERAL